MIHLFTKFTFAFLFLCGAFSLSQAQGFLHADGKNIVNGAGENVLLKGIGTGNWMLMEGYMMKTEGIAGTQHEIKAILVETIGETKTNEFFDTWLTNHFTKTDVDSMKAWGFNSVRVAMHYLWFTPPIEEEPTPGNVTWNLKGFKMIDNLLSWCAANEMYLILDLHGAPGGQGANADISDYDPSKPSLWESQANKDKTVALWKQLASRYRNSPWIGGYDIINETNWTFPEGNNSQMRELFGRITDAIREVDTNHIIFIEGNSWANDHSGLTPPWDDNMVYSFHKYWSGTSSSDLDWMLQIRDTHNVPLWMGESGENSNSWFTEFITTCEANNIGWSWWPVKKNGINNVLNVPINKEYENLVKYWKGEISTAPTADQAYQAVKQWAENHKIENCNVQRDVIDAMMRQPHTDATVPYKQHTLNHPIFFSDFDLGKNGFAYSDKEVAHYGGDYTAWNTGWGLRNDGVDIEECKDLQDTTNGYNVGWTDDNEWMQYTLHSDSTALYKLSVRHTSGYSGSKFHIEINGVDVTGTRSLPGTGAWQNWNTASFENILVPGGKIKIKYVNDQGGSNLSYFKLTNPKSASSIVFKAAAAQTSADGKEIQLSLNKEITSTNSEFQPNDFELKIDGNPITILSLEKDSMASSVLLLKHDTKMYSDNVLTMSYKGSSVKSGVQVLESFSNLAVQNNLPLTSAIPGKIEAEDFFVNKGFNLEDCSDQYGGKNTSYASAGDYLDYQVHVTRSGIYQVNYRVATSYSDAELIFQVGDGEDFTSIDTIAISQTGGWQNWETQTASLRLEAGYYFVRLLVKQGEHNLNWFGFDLTTGTANIERNSALKIYPNPVTDILTVDFSESQQQTVSLRIINAEGSIVKQELIQNNSRVLLALNGLENGFYILQAESENRVENKRFIISK
ncbi:carbohydrate-binding protein [uncultured Draconibacterium sp.]|uniref:carbohydrate-binding protein n=1 Tax=uncultured Draconibacterium sp. TaxID=1573823 RepID=UPI003216D1DF